ncbi:MAG: DEAD/DEAH box helicase [Desulfovibrio sp.]|nr:DEAD/DEAH box helicase [Desulfovibrio sp.]
MTEDTLHNICQETSTESDCTENAIAIQQPDSALPPITTEDLPESVQAGLARSGWSTLTPVQSHALPYLLARRDLMIQSRTGSGKTGAYLLPMLELLKPLKKAVQLLILVPTRELAVQVEHEAQTLCAGTGLTVCAVYGGVGYQKQTQALEAGVQLVVGTPGRILDHLLRHSLDLSCLTELVLDEADRMLSIGFYPDMKELQRYLPDKNLHTALLSATFPPHVVQLASEFMQKPDMLSLSHKEVHVASVRHCFCQVPHMDKDRALIRLLESENPASAIIFCNTKANVAYVAQVLKGFGYQAEGLSSDLTQQKRESVLQRIRQRELPFLVATDVASRGIDIPALSHVFLYEPPEDRESYIHRAGRTGRLGCAGTVISLTDVMEQMELERIARYYHIQLQKLEVPDDAKVADLVGERLSTLLESHYRSLTGLEKERVSRYLHLAKKLARASAENEDHEEHGILLLAMLLDDYHQQSRRRPSIPSAPQKAKKKSRKRPRRPPHSASQEQTMPA